MAGRLDRLRAYLYGRRHAYNQVFRNPFGDQVLGDLAQFCRASETTFHTDPQISANLEGRREVWLRIQQHLHLSPEELFELATGQSREREVAQQTQAISEDDYV